MPDKIFLQGLEVFCIIGTRARERKRKQKVVLDLEFPAPIRQAARKDDLKKALDYQKIAARVTAFVSASKFYLLETLAERLAQKLIREFKFKSISLRVSKPDALRNAKNVGVFITRGN